MDEGVDEDVDEDDGMDDFIEDDMADEPAAQQRRSRAEAETDRKQARRAAAVATVPAGPPPQTPIHPGSTPVDYSATGPNKGSRFLCYNLLGYISVGPGMEENCAAVEISFHDTIKVWRRKVWGENMGAVFDTITNHSGPTSNATSTANCLHTCTFFPHPSAS